MEFAWFTLFVCASAAVTRAATNDATPPLSDYTLETMMTLALNSTSARCELEAQQSKIALQHCLLDTKVYSRSLRAKPFNYLYVSDTVPPLPDVFLAVEVRALLDVNERSQQILLHLIVNQMWFDERLRFRGTRARASMPDWVDQGTYFPAPANHLWEPDVVFVQATHRIAGQSMRRRRAFIIENGLVWSRSHALDWFACTFSNRRCIIDIEAQSSILQYGEGLFGNNSQAFAARRLGLTDGDRVSGEWSLIDAGAKSRYFFADSSWKSLLRYEVTMQRHYSSLVFVWIALPVSLVMGCSVALIVGCGDEERYSFVGSMAVVIFLLTIGMAEKLPTSGNEVPKIMYLYVTLAVTLFGALVTTALCGKTRRLLAARTTKWNGKGQWETSWLQHGLRLECLFALGHCALVLTASLFVYSL